MDVRCVATGRNESGKSVIVRNKPVKPVSVALSKPWRIGERSVGPDGLTSHGAVSWFLPKAAVLYPLSRNISAMDATLLGRWPV
jgi:hypothetical protein